VEGHGLFKRAAFEGLEMDGQQVSMRGVQHGTGVMSLTGRGCEQSGWNPLQAGMMSRSMGSGHGAWGGLAGEGAGKELQLSFASQGTSGEYSYPRRDDLADFSTLTRSTILPTLTSTDTLPSSSDLLKNSKESRSPENGGPAVSRPTSAPGAMISTLSKYQLNEMVSVIRLDIARRNQHVSYALIVSSLMTLVGVSDIMDVKRTINSIGELKRIKELADYVDCFITCFMSKQRICTLHELETSLARSKGKESFTELLLGPLLQNPLIIREFQPPPHLTQIHAVTVIECVEALVFLRSWGKPSQIMNHLASVKGVSASELCVKIGSLEHYQGLLISMCDLQKQLAAAKEKLQVEITLTKKNGGIELDEEGRKKEQFDLREGSHNRRQSRLSHRSRSRSCSEPPHCRSAVVDSIAGQLRRRCTVVACVADLVGLQHDTAHELGASSFHALGFGDFLSFVCEEPCLTRLLNCWLGLDGGGCPDLEVVAAHARRALQGLRVGAIESEDLAVAASVRLHLRLARFGSTAWQERTVRAWEAVVHTEGNIVCGGDGALPPSGPSKLEVVSCAALLAGCAQLDGGSAHILGSRGGSVAAALRLLESAPLLADMASWTHWDAAFEAHLGGLQQFLAAHPEAGLACFDAGPHGLLRVSTAATPVFFQARLGAGDAAGAAAQLVSVVCLHDGVLRSPLSLLEHSAAAGFSQFALRAGGEVATAALAVAMIAAIPEGLRAVLADRIIIVPLGASLAVGRERCFSLMWDASHRAAGLRLALEQLGIRLSISAWTVEWAARLMPPEASPHTCTAQEPAMNVIPVADSADDGADCKPEKAAPLQVVPATSRACLQHACLDGGSDSGSAQGSDDGARQVVEARRVVEQIRMTEFGFGLALDANGAGLREALNARVGRALQRLSADLYSSDCHFLLELVQNADDNSYPADAVPELLLARGANVILVANNENGFCEADVRALCDVGRSTKAGQAGYIGQKGIGFKSVFRVTDAPQIHSNGYSVAFDTARNGDLGYILPEWIGAEALLRALQENGPTVVSAPLLDPRIWATVIVLPLREAACGGIGAMLDGLSPTLLLFLKRLRRLSVVDAPRGCRRVFERRELERGVVEVCADGEAVRYLTATRSIRPDVPRLEVVVESTDVVIAIPLPTPVHAGPAGHGLQEVFAFLPVRSYGFRFVLQADFVLPSSREAIDRDSAWNQRLRAEVPAAFALAVEQVLLAADPSDPVAAANLWLAVLPLEGEVQDFFQPCVRAVHATMRTVACIPTVECKWERPMRMMTCSTASVSVSALVDPAQLSAVLGINLVHAGLLQRPLAALGVQEVSAGTVLDLLRAGTYSPEQLPAVLGCVAEDFAGGRLSDDNHARLASLPLLLLDDGTVTSVADGPVYLPLTAAEPTNAGVSSALVASALKLSAIVRVLHPEMLGCKLSNGNAPVGPRGEGGSGVDVMRLLRVLGLQSLNLQCLVNRHVIPELTGPAKLELSQGRAVALLAIVCYYWSTLGPLSPDRDVLLRALQGSVVLWTSTGPIPVGVGAGIHFSQKFGSAVKSPLLEWLEASGWVFISSSYLELSTICCRKWRDFLLHVGVRDFVELCPRELHLIDQDLEASGDNDWMNCMLDVEPGQYGEMVTADAARDVRVVDDWHSPEFVGLLKALPSAANMRLLALCAAQYLEDHWTDEGYAEKLTASVRGAAVSDGCTPPSSFAKALRNTPWLPAKVGPCLKPAALWAHCEAVLGVFGSIDIPYLDPTLGGSGGRFVRDLGVQVRPTVRGVLRELARWSQDTAFEARTTDMRCIYAYLSNEMAATLRPSSPRFDASSGPALGAGLPVTVTSAPADVRHEIRLAFHSRPLVFLPRKARACSDRQKGSFCNLAMLRLRDRTGVVEELEGSALRVVTQHYTKNAGFDPKRHVLKYSLRPCTDAVPEKKYPLFTSVCLILSLPFFFSSSYIPSV
jgi:hypothetical protein